MLNSGNLTSYVQPIPIAPVLPDYALCHRAYGAHLNRQQALYAGGILPQGGMPVEYSVTQDDEGGHIALYELPFAVSFDGVAVGVDVAGPIDIDAITLVPNELRGMAAYLANSCVGARGTGGFVTKNIQGLVDYVTCPEADLDAPAYPDSTAFITVTVSSPQQAHFFPGDYDPAMAHFLRQVEANALNTVAASQHFIIADRLIRYTVQATRMTRLGKVAWWDDGRLHGNRTDISNLLSDDQPASSRVLNAVKSHRTRRKRRR